VSVQASKARPVGPYEMKILTGETADGSAVNIPSIDFDDELVLPSSDWYVTAWVQIKSSTADTARLLQFKGLMEQFPWNVL
jgi:hypothetical protein